MMCLFTDIVAIVLQTLLKSYSKYEIGLMLDLA
uniref:Uncharacterized protein n=1 Tax=Anguilla anguilla TaxID=7936 RepID=A0A0E9V5P8_ANGAN